MSTDWTFGGLWPYEPRWFDTADGRMHYVDEGPRDGRPVVLLHGNPTWGFLYRDFIGRLAAAGHRVIVPDHLGFGRSDKPPRREIYRIAEHIRRMDALLETLDLRQATVVPQDWGGPIGLAFHRAFLFKVGVVDHSPLTPAVRRAYLAPHPTWSSRTGVLAFPRAIPTTPTEQPWAAFAGELEAGLKRHFRDRPVRIVWAMRDPSFGPEILQSMWLDTFPDAGVLRLENAGHYLQEDAHEKIIPELLEFLEKDR